MMIYTFGPGVEIPFKTTIDWWSLTTCLWFSKCYTQFADGCSEAQHCYIVASPTNELVAEHEPNADFYILIITEQCFGTAFLPGGSSQHSKHFRGFVSLGYQSWQLSMVLLPLYLHGVTSHHPETHGSAWQSTIPSGLNTGPTIV